MNNDTNLAPPPPTDREPEPSAPGTARPPLRRYPGILGGVATGIAYSLDLAPWLVRLGFVVLSFFGGLGILLYLAGWLLIPADGDQEALAEGWLKRLGSGPSWIGAALIALAAIWAIAALDVTHSGLAWAVALLVLGVLLYRSERPAAPPPTIEAPVAGPATEPPEAAPTPPPPARSRPARPARPPSALARYTLAAGLIGIGAFALADAAGVIFPDVRHYLALALGITGLGLVVGAWWGRSRLLIATGLVLAFMMGATLVGDTVRSIGSEQRTFNPQAVEQLQDRYEMRRGTLIIDLSDLDLAGRSIEVAGELGAGELRVILPAGAAADVDARVGAGEIRALGRSSEGLGAGRTLHTEGTEGRVDLRLRVGAGVIDVTQEEAQR